MTRRARAAAAVGLACAWAVAWAAGAARAEGPPRPVAAKTLTVGSKTFTESRLLAEIMAQYLERTGGYRVERRLGLAGTKVCFEALKAGEIDLYPEYTGTGWAVLLGREDRARDPTEVALRVAAESRRRWDLAWGLPFGFNNTYAMAMSEAAAARLGVTKVSELGPHLAGLKIGVSHEFLERADGFRGLLKAYGFTPPPGLKGLEHGLAYEGLKAGRVDLVDAYSTDGKLKRFPVRLLEDDRGFFPPYHAAPLIRAAALRADPALAGLLDRFGYTITDAQMLDLNARVEVDGLGFAAVAEEYLRSRGLVEAEEESGGAGAGGAGAAAGGAAAGGAAGGSDPAAAGGGARDRGLTGFGSYVYSRRDALLARTLEHLGLTAAGVALAVFFAVPLGLALTRLPRLAPAVLGAAGILQTIPSLALLAFMIPVPGLGLGWRSAVAALFLYALLPILRNTYTGVIEVDPRLTEAARGLGLTDGEVLRLVELPLATRTIMAGVRTAGVISVGVATLAAFIGAGGLGEPILTGLQLNDTRLVLFGALPAALLAIVVDLALARAEGAVAPPG